MPSYFDLRWSIVLSAVSLVLLAIGIYGVVQDARLKIPVASFADALAIAVPLLNLAVIWLSDFTLRVENRLRIAFGWISSLLDVALLVLAAAQKWQSDLDCSLERTWQEWFSTKAENEIRNIQDVLGCCGFNSPVDRAWPFPGHGLNATACVDRYDRHTACRAAWEHYASNGLSLSFAIGLIALLTKVFLVNIYWTGKSPFRPRRHDRERQQGTLPENRLLREDYHDEPDNEREDNPSGQTQSADG